MEELIFIVGRIIFGGYFLMNGYNHFKNKKGLVAYTESKGVKSSEIAVIGTGVMLVLGGLGIILGTFIQIAMGLLVIFLIGTSLKMHDFWKQADPQVKMNEQIQFMKNMALVGALLILIALGGPWPLSL